jgi:hypothetical protein
VSKRIVLALILTTVLLPSCGNGDTAVSEFSGEVTPIEAWARVLAAHQRDGGLDYAALQADRDDLDSFLASLDSARPAAWSRAEQIAFWCNAYNAVVAHYVLERYPHIESVKAVDGFFDELRFRVAGASMTLDEIESEARKLGDARVHFAVVCASTSCPDLRGEPFQGERLEQQLEEQTRNFLSDPSKGLRWNADEGALYLSSIFKWYAGDFTGGSTVVAFFARGGIVEWVLSHLPADQARAIETKSPTVRYMHYDWSLNDR